MGDSEDVYLAVFNARLLWVRFVERNRNDVVRLPARTGHLRGSAKKPKLHPCMRVLWRVCFRACWRVSDGALPAQLLDLSDVIAGDAMSSIL